MSIYERTAPLPPSTDAGATQKIKAEAANFVRGAGIFIDSVARYVANAQGGQGGVETEAGNDLATLQEILASATSLHNTYPPTVGESPADPKTNPLPAE